MISERLRWLRTKCSRLFRRGKQEAALEAEFQFHLDQLIAQYREEGMSEREARFAAQREFGAEAAAYREEIRDTWRPPELADLWRSLRFAVRSLARSPGFTILAIITLGLGIGANTSTFSILKGIWLKPLPYPDAAQLDRIYRVTPQNPEGQISPADFLDFQRTKSAYGEVAAYTLAEASLSEPGHPAEMALAGRITANFFSLLRTPAQVGRDFRAEEDTPGRDRIVILSQRMWRNRFQLDPDIIGRTIRIDGEPHEIVGVLPETFNDWRHLGAVDFFRPLVFSASESAERNKTFLRVIFRRAPAHSPAETAGFIANFGTRLATEFPDANTESSWRSVPLQETFTGSEAGLIFAMLVGLSASVLLIACSNLANLLLARTMGRAREFAVRAALGASRTQLLRPLVAESLLLALAGGVCAIVVALWSRDWLAARSTGDNGEQVVLPVDWPVMGWAFTAALATALVFGLAPALFALRLNVNDTLKGGSRGTTGGRGHQRFRQILIVGQFALAMVLLAAAGVFIFGLHDLNNRRSGWESTQLVTGTILLPPAKYSDAEKITAFHRLVVERLASLPGVSSVSISSFTPFFNWADTRKFVAEGRERPKAGHEPAAVVNSVSPQYFTTFGTPLLAGRAFNEQDTAASTRVFIIGQATARGLFGEESPIGRRLAQAEGPNLRWGEVVGVVRDVQSVVPDPSPLTYQVYQSIAQESRAQNEIAVRTTEAGLSTPVVESIRATMAALDPDLPVRELQPADSTIKRANYQTAVLRDMLICFGLLGLGLASLGIYGVIARTMAQRRNEFAIRFALGACIKDITRIVLTSGVKLALIGSALGLLGAIGATRILAAGNPGMNISSPPVLVGTTLLLTSVALVACWLPARRAARINPNEALRAE